MGGGLPEGMQHRAGIYPHPDPHCSPVSHTRILLLSATFVHRCPCIYAGIHTQYTGSLTHPHTLGHSHAHLHSHSRGHTPTNSPVLSYTLAPSHTHLTHAHAHAHIPTLSHSHIQPAHTFFTHCLTSTRVYSETCTRVHSHSHALASTCLRAHIHIHLCARTLGNPAEGSIPPLTSPPSSCGVPVTVALKCWRLNSGG